MSDIDWRAAGRKADAHRVQRLMRGNYLSWDKDVVRRKVLRSLLTVKPSLVLDLNGGGGSAEALTAAGLNVLSVEDGRGFKAIGVTKPRGRRAFEIWAAEGGYRSAWGRAADVASQGDAAFWDFMGHWSPEVRRTLIASRHMKAIAVTLMPERVSIGERLSSREWVTAYTALLESTTGMKVRWSHVYLRTSGRQATVFFLRPARRSGIRSCVDCSEPIRAWSGARYCDECRRARRNGRTQTPEARERALDYRRTHRDENASALRRKRQLHPDQVRAEKHASYMRHRDEILARQKERYQAARVLLTKEERGTRARAGAALRNARRRASGVSGTPDEAIDKTA